MATDDTQVLVTGSASAPASFTIPGSGQIRPKTIYAKYNGVSAGTPYSPALKITSDGGALIGIYVTSSPVAAGGSANVTWFPGVDECCNQPQNTPSSVGITAVNSPLGTLTITSPTGPTVSADLSTTGVAAGGYGDGAHSAQITVDADGRITAAASVPISGGSGTIGFEIAYDQITAPVNIVSTNEAAPTTIIAGSSHTYDGSPVLVTVYAPYWELGTISTSQIYLVLYEGGTEITRLGSWGYPGGGVQSLAPVTCGYRFTPSAAAHTYTLAAFTNSTTGTPNIGAGPGGVTQYPPAYLRITKV